MTDDDTPIRRRTRKPARNRTPYIVLGGVAAACVAAFAVGVVVRAGRTGGGDKWAEPTADANELRMHRAWSSGATAGKIQFLLDYIVSHPDQVIMFDWDASFCGLEEYDAFTVTNKYFKGSIGDKLDAGLKTNFDTAAYFARREPERVSNPEFFAVPKFLVYLAYTPKGRISAVDAKAIVLRSLREGSKP